VGIGNKKGEVFCEVGDRPKPEKGKNRENKTFLVNCTPPRPQGEGKKGKTEREKTA